MRLSLEVLLSMACVLAGGESLAQSRTGNPLEDLPSHIRVLTWFGERAAWSPDGTRIAFVHKTLGDAFEIEIESGKIRCLTCEYQHAGFFRAQYLADGNFILIGPARTEDAEKARWDESEMWVLKAGLTDPPVRLNQRLSEGVATSRMEGRIAWVVSSRQHPDKVPQGMTQLWVAEISSEGRLFELVNARKVHEDKWPDCWLEAQDFRHRDRELIFSCYQPENKSEVMGVELESGKVTNYTNSPGVYDEPEGIFPDGEYTLVECDKQNNLGDHYIDIWKLKLDGTGQDYSRLTYFTDYSGYKASNPVVSPDGRWMAFQVARSKDAPGVGYGILVYDLRK